MSGRSQSTRDARRLERLYGTKAGGTNHYTVLRLIRQRGLDGAIEELEAMGFRPVTTETTEPRRTDQVARGPDSGIATT